MSDDMRDAWECRLHHAPGEHTAACRPPGSLAEAIEQFHDAVVALASATGIPAGLRRLVAWLAKRLPPPGGEGRPQ
jgi:hypothetical protein